MNYKAWMTYTAQIMNPAIKTVSACTLAVGVANSDLQTITTGLFFYSLTPPITTYLNSSKPSFIEKQKRILQEFDENYEGNQAVLVDHLWHDTHEIHTTYSFVDLETLANKPVSLN